MSRNESRQKGTAAEATYHAAVLMGIATGALVFLDGFVLCILGLTGAVELVIDAKGFSAKLANASPGVVFALLGLDVIWKYKPKVEEKALVKTVTEEPKRKSPLSKEFKNQLSQELLVQILGETDVDSKKRVVETRIECSKSSSSGIVR